MDHGYPANTKLVPASQHVSILYRPMLQTFGVGTSATQTVNTTKSGIVSGPAVHRVRHQLVLIRSRH